ncbi:MAG: DNA-directed RNA polymerase, subunit E'' [Methanocellales archaeon]|nr:DNA-directed RNA polymerase, subunit E'' [Methanocellales archaeon]MDD3421778.1 DNA-directed RNA polymerase, subunit E'' [Methanocellales archaeon]MDD4898561.1 DNA-directed RNA polymerase, subunit E'' [Methanocellales archaeon]MDD5447128.1 DNA-directed RNA polymerase, subunit E'' [Methanocellales archaeon]
MTEKACRECHRITRGQVCSCGSTSMSTDWVGYVIIIDPKRSEAAKKMNISQPGKYALKVR